MYKLILVDDEIEIRNGLKNYFPWHDIGFEVIGTFANGKQALNFMMQNSVDVVLTDIRMPVMDGIELIRKMKEMDIDAVCLLLSGYKEFEYAMSALEMGVKNYIVKPTKYQQLCEVFTKLRMELDQKKLNDQDKIGNIGSFTDANAQLIIKVKSFVNRNYCDLTLEKAAEHVRLNPYYLSSFFHQQTGEKFYDYVLRVKMENASELLRKTNKKIYEISEMVGYMNANSFSRTFKNYYNLNPKEYRSIHGSGEQM